MTILMYFVFLRLVESSMLTLLCGGKDRRYRFVSRALNEGWVKEVQIQERERTTHCMTLYSLTKRGLKYLCEHTSGTFLDSITETELRSMAIFEKDEYSNSARKRIADTSSAMIMAILMGGTVPAEVLNHCYSFGQDSRSVDKGLPQGECKTLCDFVHKHFSLSEYRKLPLFACEQPDDKQIRFYDAAYVKHAVSGSSDPKAARDFYKGREIGLFTSPYHSLLTYSAPFFGMSWSSWQIKPEINAIMVWNHRYAPKEILYSHEYSALLFVKGPQQFANLYHDVDHARKEKEIFGSNRFDHLYLAEQSAYGVALLQWFLSFSVEKIESMCTGIVLSKQLGERNAHPSLKEFLYRDKQGNEGMCGLHLDVKRMLIMDQWARRHPEQQFVVYCVKDQVPYYKVIMPKNVSYVILD